MILRRVPGGDSPPTQIPATPTLPTRAPPTNAALLVCCSVVVALLIGEVLLRAYTPFHRVTTALSLFEPVADERKGVLRPWLDTTFPGMLQPLEAPVVWHTNADGFRTAPGHDNPLERRCVRVGVFGDSETFGWGVNYADTFEALAEAQLPGVCVLNFGVPGYDITKIERHAFERMPWHDLDAVIYVMQENDLDEDFIWKAPRSVVALTQHSAVGLLAAGFVLRRVDFARMFNNREDELGNPGATEPLRRVLAAGQTLTTLHRNARDQGRAFGLVTVQSSLQRFVDITYGDQGFVAGAGIAPSIASSIGPSNDPAAAPQALARPPVLDISPEDKLHARVDGHWVKATHVAVAARLAPFIRAVLARRNGGTELDLQGAQAARPVNPAPDEPDAMRAN
jgi:hypothetical protein